jgi:UDP-N-acetylmuramoylalanine--D-glutamate ligase
VNVNYKPVLVLGLGRSGIAAARLLADRGAHVIAVDNANNDFLQAGAEMLRGQGVEVRLGVTSLDHVVAEMVVLSPGFPPENSLLREVDAAGDRKSVV